MSIAFRCHTCGAPFQVPDNLAGKHARCKKCSADLTIPRSLSREAAPVAAAAGVGAGVSGGVGVAAAKAVAARAATRGPAAAGNWIEAVTSQVGLKPLTVTNVAAVGRPKPVAPAGSAASVYDDDDDASPSLYKVGAVPSAPMIGPAGQRGKPAGFLTMFYRGQLGGLQGLFRTLNESAYLISVPFLLLLGFGILVHNKPLAILGATAVVLLNLSRLVTGLANLVVIPFRDSPIQGILFCIPPLSLIYALQHWKKIRKPVKRIIEPGLTILAVVLVFAFVPWLTGQEQPANANLIERVEAGAKGLRTDMRQQLRDLPQRLEKPAGGSAAPADGATAPDAAPQP